MIERIDLVQDRHRPSAEWREVLGLADSLVAFLQRPDIAERVKDANQPQQSSARVQAAFIEEAHRLGFVDESKGLFRRYASSALRPDYYRPVGTTGVIMEVERGKTTINNMDLLDFWKCHICEHASYLLLMVPVELRQNPKKPPSRPFDTVAKRLASFFMPANYTNVHGLVLLGY
ncbi:MAG: hypothetical protein OXI55_15535 [Gammaproteobacteria bacterium]|nr:hypothetical protein [Gammaproteobacteria bacterium]